VTGILHLIFFHRYFPNIRPSYFDVLDLTLPGVPDTSLESLIDTTSYQLSRQLSGGSTQNGGLRGSIEVQFFEKKRKKKEDRSAQANTAASLGTSPLLAGGVQGIGNWFAGVTGGAIGVNGHNGSGADHQATGYGKDNDSVCWEIWRLRVSLVTPRTETGMLFSAMPDMDGY
jgi:autophagy-related protein 101